MKLAVMGVGGVGGYFGARLAAAGNDVAFIARGAHLAAIRGQGLRVLSAAGDLDLKVAATDDPAEIGPVDLVMFTVKLWDTETAAEAIGPLIGPNTAVVSFQNGVEARHRLSAILGPEHVIGGVCHIAAVIESPGVIHHTGTLARLTLGEFGGAASGRAEAFVALAQAAGIDAVLSSDIERAIWEKFVFLASFSGITAVTRLPIGPLREDAETRAFLRAAITEAAAVAAAQGVDLGADAVDRQMGFADKLPQEMKSSMLGDLERGSRLELPWLSGAVVRLGAETGVPTPAHAFIRTALKLHSAGWAR